VLQLHAAKFGHEVTCSYVFPLYAAQRLRQDVKFTKIGRNC